MKPKKRELKTGAYSMWRGYDSFNIKRSKSQNEDEEIDHDQKFHLDHIDDLYADED